jgi:hydrogenase nickel incorporation protein HypA/HybF
MHEVSLVHALFDQVERAIAPHPPDAVRRLTVRIGELAGVDAELFRLAFDGCKEERGYPAAELHLVHEAAAWRCTRCGVAIETGEVLSCASCDGVARLAAGGELMLDRVELEVRDV